MNSYDAENHILRQKAAARAAADAYLHQAALDQPGDRLARQVYHRAMAGVGERLVSLGYRLQGEINQLAARDALSYEVND
jgi:hypothetical protein